MGEHIQVLFRVVGNAFPPVFTIDIERFGEIGRSNENRTEEADVAELLYRLTRVGEVDLWRRREEEERGEKVEAVEEAKADEEENDGVLEE